MAGFAVEEILNATGARWRSGPKKSVDGVSIDSRQVKANSLYVAIKGERFDGADFLREAVAAGATAILIHSETFFEDPTIDIYEVIDTQVALGKLANWHRMRFCIPVIGVTGSAGKTSTKDVIAALLGTPQEVLKTVGNFNNEIGVPLTLLGLNSSHHFAVIEMGMRGLGEIAYLAEIAQPQVGVITNVGDAHMERLGSRNQVAQAKSELISALRGPESLAVLNFEDSFVLQMKDKAAGKVLTYGCALSADVSGQVLQQDQTGMQIRCFYGREEKELHLPFFGIHQMYNSLAAIGVARALGRTWEEIQAGFESIEASPMRMEKSLIQGVFVLNDAYNANPQAMDGALEVFSKVGQGKKVALLGDMLELGDLAESCHLASLKFALDLEIDLIIVKGPEMNKAASVLKSERILANLTDEEIAKKLSEVLQAGDSLFVKGSRGMRMENLLESWIALSV